MKPEINRDPKMDPKEIDNDNEDGGTVRHQGIMRDVILRGEYCDWLMDSNEMHIGRSRMLEYGEFIEEIGRRAKGIEKNSGLPQSEIDIVRQKLRFNERMEDISIRLGALLDEFTVGIYDRIEPPEAERLRQMFRKEAIEMRHRMLEERGLFLMSEIEFEKYFGNNYFPSGIRQQNMGYCYNNAAIWAMRISPNFEMLCRSSMKRMEDGSWEVKVPFLSDNGQTIVIRPEDIAPQDNPRYYPGEGKGDILFGLKELPHRAYGRLLDEEEKNEYESKRDFKRKRGKLNMLKGPEGMRVLEAVFIVVEHSKDRLAAEGGQMGDVLEMFSGKNFNRERIRCGYDTAFSKDDKKRQKVEDFFKTYDKRAVIATAASRYYKIGTADDASHYSKTSAHGYAITYVNLAEKKITLANPHDTSIPIYLSFDEFMEKFYEIDAVRVNYARLLGNMKMAHRIARRD